MADIAVCSECSGEMDVTAAAPFNRVACPNCGVQVRVKVDFGNYLLQTRLAFGGMSILFVALDQTLGREVALKVLNEEYSSDEFRTAQFEKEAELTALVSHPNVVRVYSVGRAFERFYIAMELIAGESLEKRLETGQPMPEEEVLKIALQVAAGLKAAKASGLIHRDIKPGNILVDEAGNTKIVDFGLSLVTQAGSAQAQEVFATPYYAPPEALEAGVEDFRSDIYALGASLYHALAGKPPIETTSTSTKTLLEAKRKTRSLKQVAPHVSKSTSDIVSAMMALDREARPESYLEVTEGLQRALDGEPQVEKAHRSRSRRKGSNGMSWVAGLLILALVVIAALVLKGRQKDDEVVEKETAPPQIEDTGPSEAMMITRTYGRAREALQNGRFNEAELNFLKLYRKSEVPEPTGTWAGFEAGLAALLDGRAGDARRVYAGLAPRVENAPIDFDTQFALDDMLAKWNDFAPYAVLPKCPTNPELAMVEFAKKLRNWEQGEQNVVPFLDAFAKQEFTTRKEWVEVYQEWAVKIVADARLLEEAEPDWQKVWSPSEVDAELARVTNLAESLQTSGRARFTVESWQDWFEGLKARRKKPSWTEES